MKRVLLALVLTAFSPLYGLTFPFSLTPTPPPPSIFVQDLTLAGPNANPQVAVAANGQAIAVWTNFPNQIEIQAAFYNNGIGVPNGQPSWVYLNNANMGTNIPGFASVVRTTGTNAGTIALGSSPKVGIDQYGNATIVWVSPNSQIIAARYNGSSLSSVTQLTATGTSNISPTLAINQHGTVVVVWIQATSYRVLASSAYINGPWGTAVTFMPIFQNNQGIPVNPNGTYPASFSLSNNLGTMVWLDGPTGIVRAGNFSIP